MKVAYLTQTFDQKTGSGRFANDIIQGVKARGHEVVVITEYGGGLSDHVVLHRGWGMFRCIKEVKSLIGECDVIHAIDGYPYAVIAWLANRTLHKKLIISALGTYAVAPLYRWQTSFLLKKAYQSANKVAAVSRFTEREISKKVKLKNTVIVNPGIQKDLLSQTADKIEGNFILGVGAIKERKGYHIALSAFAKIAKDFPQINYVIVADPFPPFQAILDKIIKDNNILDRVTFLHGISDEKLDELYSSATLFALTPINATGHHIEGFGLVYLEAARAGLPVIGTFGTGAEEAVNNGRNGILVPENDIDGTADAMAEILSNKDIRKVMSEASREWAQFNSVEREVGAFIALYQNS